MTTQEFTTEQVRERFNKLPPEVQDLISSQEALENIQSLAKDRGLMIDQQGELVDQITMVMLGWAKSSDFVRDISIKLGIDNAAAQDLAREVNKMVFDPIRTHMREIEDSQQEQEGARTVVDNSALEAAGGFTIESEIPGNGEEAAERESATAQAMTSKDKVNLLADIENPKPTRETTVPRGILIQPPIKTEPLVDQLLKAAASIPEEKLVRKVAEEPNKTAPPPNNLPTDDHYREPIT